MRETTIETLENRLCLSASIADGALVVEGTAGDDVIRVSVKRNQFVVRDTRGSAPQLLPVGSVSRIVVRSLDGNDRIRVDRTTLPTEIDAGPGDDLVAGGFGNDRILGGDGSDRLQGRSGDDELRGQAGNDVISGGAGTDASDFDFDLVTGVERFPDIPPEQLTPELFDLGLPLGGFAPTQTTGENTGNPAGFSTNLPANPGPQQGGRGDGGSLVLAQPNTAPIDTIDAGATTTTQPSRDILAGGAGGSIRRPTSGGSLLGDRNGTGLATSSPVTSSLFSTAPVTTSFFG